MKRIKLALCSALIAGSMLSANALAADFSFTLVNTGVDYSELAKKGNDKSFASVSVDTANNYTYKYAVGTGITTGYVSGWKEHKGTGSFDISYTSTPANGTGVRLHGATVSASGTSTVSGT